MKSSNNLKKGYIRKRQIIWLITGVLLVMCLVSACKKDLVLSETEMVSDIAETVSRGDIPFQEGGYTWDENLKTLTFLSSGDIEGFYFDVPEDIEKILIQSDVTIVGALNINHSCTIEGESWDTSVIYGTDERRYCQNNDLNPWEHNAIGVYSDATVYVKNLKVLNPRGYCISGYEPESIIHLEHVKMIDDRGGDQNNSDGFIGADGSTVKDCYFDLGDDVIKLYRDMEIEDIEIVMNHNGAPFQLGWNDNNNTDVTATLRNIKITGSIDSYNLAVFSWVNEHNTKTMNLFVEGCYIELANGSLFKLSPETGTTNIFMRDANIAVGMYGINQTAGTISIDGSSEMSNYYSYNGLIPKPEVKEAEPSPYQAVAVYGTPLVDGVIDDLWLNVPEVVTDQIRLGEKETTAHYQMMWDDEFFYMLARVEEENPLNNDNTNIWNKDSIELFLDDNNGKSAAYQLDDRHTIFAYDGSMERFDVVKLDRVEAVSTIVEGGYMIELKVPLYSSHEVGDILGFDVQTNSTAGTNSRASITGWSGSQDLSDKKPEVWGDITLVD